MFNLIIQHFCSAMMLLTRLPIWRVYNPLQQPKISDTVYMYPIIGLLLGCFYALVYTLLFTFNISHNISIILTICVSLLTTGCFHEDGLADMADGFGGGFTKDRKLEIMRDSRLGTYGAAILCMSLLLRYALLETVLTPFNAITLFVLTESLSRMPIAILAYLFPYARPDDPKIGVASAGSNPDLKYVLLSIIIGLLIALACLKFTYCVILIILLLIVNLCLGYYSQKQIGGVSGDIYGASQQINSITILIFCLYVV